MKPLPIVAEPQGKREAPCIRRKAGFRGSESDMQAGVTAPAKAGMPQGVSCAVNF